MNTAELDIVVHGATGFVGRLISQYLVQHYSERSDVRWGLSARSQEKLDQLRIELGDEAKQIPVFCVDSEDESALKSLCSRTRVVLSVVGPYARYGEALVRACSESGTHYCDITGEVPWIYRMREEYQSKAAESGACIVHCCGFDSIPSDLGVYEFQRECITRHGKPSDAITMGVQEARGGFSGGTIASLLGVLDEAQKDPAVKEMIADPYCLLDPTHSLPRYKPTNRARYDEELNSWVAPFIMSAINIPVVHWSNELLQFRYGRRVRYDETVITSNRVAAVCLSAGQTLGLAAASIQPLRYLLEKLVFPQPGQGPSKEAQEKGFFDLIFVGKEPKGDTVSLTVSGSSDPGYSCTAKMATEAAVCLAQLDADRAAGGFWTPASLLAPELVERLSNRSILRFALNES